MTAISIRSVEAAPPMETGLGADDLSDAERRDVQAILATVAAGLTHRATTAAGVRRKLDAVIAELIDITDLIAGYCDDTARDARLTTTAISSKATRQLPLGS